MQSRCRRGDRPSRTRVDRLVPLAVVGPVIALDVRRQRDVPQPIDRIVKIPRAFRAEAYETPPEELPLADLRHNPHAGGPIGVFEDQSRSRLEFLTGMHKRVPFVVVDTLEQETLGSSPAWVTPTYQAGGEHASIVGHDAITGRQQPRQVTDLMLGKRPRAPIDDQQTRRPTRARLLSDERLGKIEIEISDERHGH
jgi:hypothetical protein